MFGLGKHANDKVVIVSRAEWEEMQADVRGLKRLASLEEQARNEQNARFAQAIDTLDARSQEMATLSAALAGAIERNATEFSNRIDRMGAAVGEMRDARATDIAALAEAHNADSRRLVDAADGLAALGLGVAALETELAATRGELTGRLDVQSEAIERLVREAIEAKAVPVQSITDALASAPLPDIEAMRAFYAEKRAKAGHETTAMPERAPRIVVVEDDNTHDETLSDPSAREMEQESMREASDRAQQEPV